MTELIAYLDDNKEWSKDDILADKLTMINYAFANIIGLEVKRELKKIHLINELKETHPHLKTCISIGGWSADGFSDGVATEENRTTLIKNIIQYILRYDFDGVDLDWEYPGMDLAGIKASKDDAKNFLSFVKELREALDIVEKEKNQHYYLTAAIGAAKSLLDTMSPDGNYTYIDYLDFVNVMTYDMRGSFTNIASHHTNLYAYNAENGALSVMQSVENLRLKNVPVEKIVIGAAFYSRNWSDVPTSETGLPVGQKSTVKGSGTTDFNQLREMMAKNPENFHWDEVAHAPYYYDGSNYSSFDSEKSMKEKGEFVIRHELRGLMFWEYSLDLSGDLVNAAFEPLKNNLRLK